MRGASSHPDRAVRGSSARLQRLVRVLRSSQAHQCVLLQCQHRKQARQVSPPREQHHLVPRAEGKRCRTCECDSAAAHKAVYLEYLNFITHNELKFLSPSYFFTKACFIKVFSLLRALAPYFLTALQKG